jgi:hypothetical protein
MAIDFPSSPTLNQTYTFNGRTWKWNGTAWVALSLEAAGSAPAGLLHVWQLKPRLHAMWGL